MAGRIRVSPFGMGECCLCDAGASHTIPDGDEFLPYCERCARLLLDEFPDARLYLLSGFELAPSPLTSPCDPGETP